MSPQLAVVDELSPPPGTEPLLVGRYALDEAIGSGVTATVYRAFDSSLERWVAIKLMHRGVSTDPDQRERFRREGRAAAQLHHRHVVTVIDAGEDRGLPYIVLELVQGETLSERIRRLVRLPLLEATRFAIEIGRGLGCAHSHGLVHRDVKPGNVLIDLGASAKITDFGVAHSLDAGRLTNPGQVMGSVAYISPEAALGREVTEQSDVYSLGICLYEMLTGELPFQAANQVAVALQHVRDPLPDIRRRRPDAPQALAAVLERATAKEAGRRYTGVARMVDDLEQVLATEADVPAPRVHLSLVTGAEGC